MTTSLKNLLLGLFWILAGGLILRFGLLIFIGESFPLPIRILAILAIFSFGAFFVLTRSASIIEETTEVLSEKTHLAGGFLQSLGTAFPDMILGVSAAFISLSLRNVDYSRALSFAIIAAATTFGSNIYNIGFAAWCIWRQNQANEKDAALPMFPGLKNSGRVIPMREHLQKPYLTEISTAIAVLIALTILTAAIAISMVLFGRISTPPTDFQGDLYQLSAPLGIIILVFTLLTLYRFRKTERPGTDTKEIKSEENLYRHASLSLIFGSLLVAGISILFAAESMVKAVEVFSVLSHTPYIISGILTGIIGCLGEMIVVYNFSVNPNGRIGDAVVGVAMDNIVTIAGACLVAVMGGIFLGGGPLIILFVLILALNSILLWQIDVLKNFFIPVKSKKGGI